MSKTHPFMQQLQAQAANRLDFPNIPTQRFESVKRNLQLYMLKTYGIRVVNPAALNTGAFQTVDFMVLAVQGQKNASSHNLKRNVIYIANQVFNPKNIYDQKLTQQPSFTLHTIKNPGVVVTIQQALGNGAIVVNEPLVEDILLINSQNQGGSVFPYLRYVGPFSI